MAKLTDDELKALLSKEIQSAGNYAKTELSVKRARAMEYYRGDVKRDIPDVPGRSKVVSNDVADTIGWMLPGIIRVFTASDRFGIYEPVRPSDKAFCEQATDYANYIFWKDNNGYRILWDATHDSLLQANGVVKHWWDDTPVVEHFYQTGMTAEQIALLQDDQNLEIVAQKPGEPQIIIEADPETGQPVQTEIETFDIKVERTVLNGKVRIESIEPENFLMDRDARFIEEARFTAHREEKTRSDLIEMGFDKKLVENLNVASRISHLTEEAQARDAETLEYNDSADDSMQLVELYECYVKADIDGDGLAETVRAFYAGGNNNGELLDWEVWEDDVPFSDIPCEPVPHRWDARSISDETMDMQRIKTVLSRQLLDNLYWVNNPLRQAEEKSVVNPEMLTAPIFGGTVWRKSGSQPVAPLPVPFIGDKALAGLEHFDQVIEKRTGVSRSTMALDPETLQNQTATANQNQKDAAYSQIELIARNQAELGWKRVFRQILKLIVKHQDRPRTIRLRDTFVDMDPRSWSADMDVTVNVGLGTGSRDRDMAMLNTVLANQVALTDKFATGGFVQQALEMLPKVVTTMKKIAESAGLRNPDDFYPDITPQVLQGMAQQAQQMASRPDPKMQIEQMKAQANMQIQQSEFQSNQIRVQAEIEKSKAEAQIKIIEAEAKAREADMKQQLAAAQIQVDQLKSAATNQTTLAKAAIDNLVRLEIARINASKDTDTKPDAVESKLSSDAGVRAQ